MELKDFLKKIQMADEGSKKKIIIATSIIIVLIVLAVWLKFFGGFMAIKFPKV